MKKKKKTVTMRKQSTQRIVRDLSHPFNNLKRQGTDF